MEKEKKDFFDWLAESPIRMIAAALAAVVYCWLYSWFIAAALDSRPTLTQQKQQLQQLQQRELFYQTIKAIYNDE